MPSILINNSIIFNKIESQFKTGRINHELISFIHVIKHNKEDDCCCHQIANYFIIALKNTANVHPCSLLQQLVSKSIELLRLHSYTNPQLDWFNVLLNELCSINKTIKDCSAFSDNYIPLPLPSDFTQTCSLEQDSTQEQYGRAIRIAIYHCRALFCDSPTKSVYYYRKVLSVPPTPFDQQNIQQSVMIYLKSMRPALISYKTSSTISTQNGIDSMTCGCCGIEKKHMPICSKCKSQAYCSIRCLKLHKPTHDIDCRQLSASDHI